MRGPPGVPVRIYIRFSLFAITVLALALPAHAWTTGPAERQAEYHDWRVYSKDGRKCYGVAGDPGESYIWFGASPLRVRAPFYTVVAGLALLLVGLADFIRRIVRRMRTSPDHAAGERRRAWP